MPAGWAVRKVPKSVKLPLMQKENVEIAAFELTSKSDAAFAGGKGDRKLISGVIHWVNGVKFTCHKQTAVDLSTVEADSASASNAGQELLGCMSYSLNWPSG